MKINLCRFREYLGDLFREERNTLPDEFSSCDVKVRHLSPGGLFIAFDDEENDGVEHIPDAVAAGAAAIATTLDFSELPPEARGLGYIRIDRPTLFSARAAELFAGFPADRLKLYAVTGTNGKTTSAMLLHTLLQNHFGSAGLISTIGCDTGSEFRQTGYTTPPPFEVEWLFNEMLANGIPAAALENSSHGLDQYRTASAKFEAAIFTNLTGDHLDYHHTMDNYFSAKRRMFLELVKPEGVAVINIDDPWGRLLLEQTREHGVRAIGFGRSEQADCRITDVCCSAANSIYKISGGDRDPFEVITPLCGEHNVYNTCGVVLAGLATGIPLETVLSSIAADVQIPGRLEHLTNGRIDCFVDYAHTDDALARVLSAIRPWCAGKLIVVFGAGGDRDRTKRPRMGKAAAAGADVTVVTSDNPRTENPDAIIRDILGGIPPGSDVRVEPDRRAAIKLALTEIARPGDIVLLAGKGHEDYQEINSVRTHLDDREEAWKWL